MNEILTGLINIVAENYQLIRINNIISKLKALGIDEAVKSDIIAALDKVKQNTTESMAEVNQLILKYNKTENVEPEKEDEDEDIY